MADIDVGVWVAIKPVAPVLEVDWLTGAVHCDIRHLVRTPADAAACAVGAVVAAELGTAFGVLSVAAPSADSVLAGVLAEGAARAVRLAVGADQAVGGGPDDQLGSNAVASALAGLVGAASVVVCGDASGDRGSGTVPGFLAGELAVPQALSLRDVTVREGRIEGTRRVDGGRRERIVVDPPCVLSVASTAGVPARASLAAVLATAREPRRVEVVRVGAGAADHRGDPPGTRIGPFRPRPSDLASPQARDAVARAIEVVGTRQHRDPPELLRCDPDAAAEAILDRLSRWGLR